MKQNSSEIAQRVGNRRPTKKQTVGKMRERGRKSSKLRGGALINRPGKMGGAGKPPGPMLEEVTGPRLEKKGPGNV